MKKLFILFLFLACTLSVVTAQETPADTSDSREITADTQMTYAETQNDYSVSDKPSKNFIKVNLPPLVLKNFSLQYERVLTKRMSGAVTFSLMPERNLPSILIDAAVKGVEMVDPDVEGGEGILQEVLISSYSVTPEIRFYLGKKGYGRGFYTALFYRYGHFEASNLLIPWSNDDEEEFTVTTGGAITSHTGGFLMGYQWGLGKHMCLDWQMFGPHFGVSKGDFLGVSSSPLSEQDQIDIEGFTLDVPLLDLNVDASANEVKVLMDGPWAGIRFSISLGVKF